MTGVKKFLKENGAWIGFAVLIFAFSAATQGDFLSARNLTNLMRQASINGILAGGMTLIILTGGIDLSIGSLVAVAGVIVGISQVQWGWSEMGGMGSLYSMLLALGVGALAGLSNGLLVAWLGLAPFVITLGMMVIARGASMIFSGGASISPMSEALNEWAGSYLGLLPTGLIFALLAAWVFWQIVRNGHNLFLKFVFPLLTLAVFGWSFFSYRGFPSIVIFLLVVLGALAFILRYTVMGRSIYALGSNEKAAYWAGVPIKKVTVFVYTVMGFLSGLAALLLTSRLNSADPNAGQLFELDAIAAVVIGGTSLKGGSGTILGSLVGALTIATLNNGMDLMGVSSFYQMVFKGLIIIAAVSLDQGQRSTR
jgi:D-xylose transport system permease protein